MGRRAAHALAAAAALLLLAWATGALPLVRFTRERIVLAPRGDALVVEGRYVYENVLPFPVAQGLDVPFATGDGQTAPATVEAWVETPDGRVELPVRWVLGTPRLEVRVPPRGEVVLGVRFEQRCAARRGTYLLTTTRPWGRALLEAEYVVRLAPGVRLEASSLPLDGLRCARRDFMPEADWRLAWR